MARLEDRLIAQALELGFTHAGIAAAEAADDFEHLTDWLDHDYAGEMHYMHKHREARRHPLAIYPEVRSVVMLAMSYAPSAEVSHLETPFPARLALYAQGADYHQVLRERMWRLCAWMKIEEPTCWGRVVVDTAPLLERSFARRAGLGWFGKNSMLIHPRHGSWFLLGGILTNLELQPSDPFTRTHCGTCTACLDACPTGAFVEPYVLDARRCISYLTIELKSDIPEPQRPWIDDWLFGCDICQEVCPWNRRQRTGDPALAPREDLAGIDAMELLSLSEEQFAQRFEGTALYPRPGRPVVLRNAVIILGNTGDERALPALEQALNDEEERIRVAAAWAIEEIRRRAILSKREILR